MREMTILVLAGTQQVDLGDRIDLESGEVRRRSYVPLAWAHEHNLPALPIPPDFAIGRRKDPKTGTERVRHLHEIADFILVAVDGDGRIVNEPTGSKNLSRPLSLDLPVLEALIHLFRSGADQTGSRTR